ncbi:MAG: hypothetical protein JXB23_14170 [Candidatus Aminicenantes bacterium]|nr:hypothetical protein [Candidatus Aminicenantes bacterium]
MSVFEWVIGLGVVCMVIFVVSSILIMAALEKRGVKTNFLLIRLLLPKYAHQYKTMTKQEEGKTGSLFYWWVLSINCALLSFLVALIAG